MLGPSMPIFTGNVSRNMHSLYQNFRLCSSFPRRATAFAASPSLWTSRRQYSEVKTAEEKQALRRQLEAKAKYISTLLPSKLTESDYIDPSGSINVLLCSPGVPQTIRGSLPLHSLRYSGFESWPERVGGFLYLHEAPSGAPTTAASLRFRVTNDSDPKSFAEGADLIYGGLPWRTPVIYVNEALLKYMLEKEELLPQDVVERMVKLHKHVLDKTSRSAGTSWGRPNRDVIYSRSQLFNLDFSRPRYRTWILKEDNGADIFRVLWIPLPALPADNAKTSEAIEVPQQNTAAVRQSKYLPLYKGSVVARFECSEPSQPDEGGRVAIRVEKVIEPVVRLPNHPSIELPEIKEGSYVPFVDIKSNEVTYTHGPFPPAHALSVLASLPDVKDELDEASCKSSPAEV